MKNLLYIEASPRKENSISTEFSKKFLSLYQEYNPLDRINILKVWEKELPEFNGSMLDAKYAVMTGQTFSENQNDKWQKIIELYEDFANNALFVFSIPMWNFGIPYKLKHFIDLITQPGLAFNFSPESGYTGLLEKRKALIIYSSGGSYDNEYAQKMDFQKPYMQTWLNFIGIHDIQEVTIAPTLIGSDAQIKAARVQAESSIVEIARNFG